jgi:PTS system fructose-specific IIA component/PTS system nitrogen regulatory IIA component
MRLTDYLAKEFCIMDLKATTKEEAIKELVSVLASSGKVKDKDDFVKHILERERLGSTGIGNKVAIPHAPTQSVEGLLIACGRSKQGIDFQSHDGEEVNSVFLIGTNPGDLNLYLKLLASLSKLLNDKLFRDEFAKVESGEGLIELFKKYEKSPVAAPV